MGKPAELQAFRAGDREIMGAVFRATAPMLRGLLYACGLRSAADIDDAVQTVYLKAFTAAAREAYSGLSPYPNYLKSIARNVVRDLQKSGRARYKVLDPERVEVENSAASWSDPVEQLEQAEARTLRQRFVAALRPPQDRVYEVCYARGLSEREAATELELSRHKVRTALAGIQRALKRFIREHGLDD